MTTIRVDGGSVRTAQRVGNLPVSGLAGLLRGGLAGMVDLATGTPAAPQPPPALLEQACAALRAGVNQYANLIGNPELRGQIAGSLGTPADPDTEITVTIGATEALTVALLATVDPGDEVIVFEPFFDNFLGAIALAGGRPRFVQMRAPDWRFDAEELAAAFGPRTKAILLNTPNNPTGKMLDRGEAELIAQLCEKWNVTVVSDEVYAAYTFDGRAHLSVSDVPALARRSIVLGSFSKSHAISGWRVGYLRADPLVSQTLRQVHVSVCGSAAAPLQHAIAAAGVLSGETWNPAADMQRLRDRAAGIFSDLGLDCGTTEGGCYVMADLSTATDTDSAGFADLLRTQAKVMIAPGTFFYADPRDGARFVRIAFNKSPHTLDEAQNRLRQVASRAGRES
ncbi:MAG TPA: aminotransferase class I/II-fold pyridoxal phosphate-dependent enzyme [Pseudonocardiaceae bacterium]|nr:aminotransferase class I/II-fold pyridoxal phosphate-dependent enzyme [Pseudonocardiaceae bacterium]